MNNSLNHIYRVVWNASLGLWQVASEVARNGGKTQSEQRRTRRAKVGAAAVAGAFAGLASIAIPSVAFAQLPTGGQVVGGQASIVQSGNALNINQGTDRAAIDWQSFNVGQGNTVNFNQPSASSIALNRVLGNDVSVIQGSINANGQVFLVNQNGILFTPTAQVNVGGIVASTQSISTADFMAGKYTFSGNSTGTVENQGNITTSNGGTVALIAAKIINTGTITAPQGTVGLAAGNTVTLDLGGPVKIQVTEGALHAEITQGGAILADGGQIFLTAKSAGNLTASVINHTGISRALSMAQLAGVSTETASAPASSNIFTGAINFVTDILGQQGTIDASGTAPGAQGGNIDLQASLIIDSGTTKADGVTDGGTIRMRANEVLQSKAAKVSASGEQGAGGKVQITGDSDQNGRAYLSGTVLATGRREGGEIDATAYGLTLAGATLDSSGTADNAKAGRMRIGGGWQGMDANIANAMNTIVNGDTTLTNQGLDGMVVVWSDGQTAYGATLNARGSDVEISGKENLSANLDGVAAKTLLLDPKNITIVEAISTASFASTVIANPQGASSGVFGERVIQLANENLIVADAKTKSGLINNAGRVYLFSKTGSLLATYVGVRENDMISSGGITVLKGANQNNFVINSPDFSTTVSKVGAVTWANGSTASGTTLITQSNSLVGVRADDRVGSGGITALSNGNFVVLSPDASFSISAAKAGAVTFGKGATGVLGQLNTNNSFVGTQTDNRIGSGGVFELTNGDYVISSPDYSAGRGAVTRVSGVDGKLADGVVAGTINASGKGNSLSGGTQGDRLSSGGIVALSDGGFAIVSPDYSYQPAATLISKAGAVHWVAAGVSPTGSTNQYTKALVGAVTNDRVGSGGVTALNNGAFVVASPEWSSKRGAATFVGNGSTLDFTNVTAANSLTGANTNDQISVGGITKLSDGNYVVNSFRWNGNRGAVTWANGSNGLIGSGTTQVLGANVTSSNSLTGRQITDFVGSINGADGIGGVVALDNGRYVIVTPQWGDDVFFQVRRGAVTWSNAGGIRGFINSLNSLIGSTDQDQLGIGGVVKLSNGNYAIASGLVDVDGKSNAGLVAVVDGTQSVFGSVMTVSSFDGKLTRLTGANANELLGGTMGNVPGSSQFLYALNNGNLVVRAPSWNGNTGAVTWLNGTLAGTSSFSTAVSAVNSLVGSKAGDQFGSSGNPTLQPGVVQISDTHYAVISPRSNGLRGSVTFASAIDGSINGTTNKGGTVNATNSILGDAQNLFMGSDGANAQRVFLLGELGANSKIAIANSLFATGGGVLITDGKFVQATGTPGSLTDGFNQFNGADGQGGVNSSILRSTIQAALNNGTAVTLKANNDITVKDAVIANSNATGALTLEAGRNINFNASVNTGNGNLTAIAGAAGHDSANRDSGDSTITLANGVKLSAGTGTINLIANNVGSNIGKFVNNAGATPFTAAKTFIYLPGFNTTGNDGVTHVSLNGLTVNSKRYNTTFNATTGSPTSTTARLNNLTGVNLLYAAAPVLTVAPSNLSVQYGEAVSFESSPLGGFVDGDNGGTPGALLGTEVIDIVGADPVNGLRNAGKYNLVYKSGYTSELGYTFADSGAADELTITPRNLTVTTNNFLGNATDTLTVIGTEGLVKDQTFTGLNLTDNVLTSNFGQNTLGSNYSTTVLVPGAPASDLTVNRPLTFNGLNLTLKSDKNINIRNTITAQGANDKVQLRFGQGAVAANNTADLNFALSPDGFGGKLNIHEGNNFSTVLGSDGAVIDYTVIAFLGAQGSTTGTDLQGINGKLDGNFALGADIDAATAAQWNEGAGFDGIGSASTPFVGRFTGLGHQITTLTINRPGQSAVGLFDRVGNTATVRDVQLTNVKLNGNFNVGALAGSADAGSRFYQVASSGEIQGNASVGGLIGFANGSTISQSFSAATVSSQSTNAGGLVGESRDLTLKEVFATGAVTGTEGVGGLVGRFATLSAASITDAYATGAVIAKDVQGSAGGLIGVVSTDVLNNVASYDVSFDRVYATGKVTGGDVSSGGLIGIVRATNNSSGALATVALTNSFWDINTTERASAIGTKQALGGMITDTTALSKTTAELKQRATFTPAGWNIAGSGGAYPVLSFGRSATVWTTGALQIPVTVTFNALTGTYTYKASEYALTDLFSTASLFGQSCEVCSTTWKLGTDYTFSFNNTTVTGFTDAGTYKDITVKVLNQEYALADTGNTLGSLTIDRARITSVTGITANNRAYNGNTTAELVTAAAKFTGVLQNETGTLTVATATGNFADKNVGDNKTVNITNITLGGTAAKNYELNNASATGVMPVVLNTATTASTQANITRLTSVMWVGGATGNWFDAANWAGGAVPDLSNVASVVLPANVKVNFNGAMDAVMIDTLGASGALDMASGTLNVGTGGITLSGFNQTGGTLSTTGNFNVTQTEGPIQLGQLTVGGTLNVQTNGAISQLAGSALKATGAASFAAGKNAVTLANTGNDFGSVGVTGTTVSITDTNAISLDAINATSLIVKAGGAVTQNAAAIVSGTTNVDAMGFDVTLNAKGNDLNVLSAKAKDLTVSDEKGGIILGNITATGNTSVTSTGGDIIQGDNGESLVLTGTLTLNAKDGENTAAVTLNGGNNTFTGAVSATGSTVSLKAKGSMSAAVTATDATLNAGGNLAISGMVSKGLTTTTTGTDSTTTFGNTTVGGDLSVTSTGNVAQQAMTTLSVTGKTTVTATGKDVSLGNAGNDFGTVSATSKDLTIADAKGGVVLDKITATGNTSVTSNGGAISQAEGSVISVTGTTALSAKDGENTAAVTLNGTNNTLTGSVSATGSAVTLNAQVALTAAVTATEATLSAAGNLGVSGTITKGLTTTTTGQGSTTTFGTTSVGTDLSVTSTGKVAQLDDKATLSVTNKATISATGQDVTLANAGNDFGSVGVTGAAVSITDKNTIALDNIKSASLALKAGGAVTQLADKAVEVIGATSVNAGTNNVTLSNAGNDFNTVAITAGAASIIDKNAVVLDNIKAASLTLKTGGAVTQVAEKALEVTGATSVDAGANDVTLANTNNDFGSVGVTAKAASITDKNAIALDNIKAASLTVKAGGVVTQVAEKALEVTGATSVDAGANDVTLVNTNNDFGSIGVTAKAVSIVDKNAIALDNIKAASLTLKVGSAVTQVADKALEVTGATTVDAGANNVTLANVGNDFNSVAITAGAASIIDKNAVALDNIKAASLAVKAGGAVTQVAEKVLEVTGATTVNAGTNGVALANAGNDFNTVAITAGAASVTDKNAVALDNIKAASLAVKAGGAVTQVADKALEVTGATTVDAGANNVTLANAGNDFNTVAITAGAASITDKNAVALDNIKAASLNVKAGGAVTQVADKALEVTGATSVDAGTNNVTLANAGNDFNTVAITAGVASVTDKNAVALDNIKAASLTLKAGGAVTQVADKALEVTGATSVDAGTNDVTLANANNDFGSIGVTAGAASITDKNAVALDNIKAASLNVKAGGAVTQVADKALEVTGATSVDAGTNSVTLANAGNDFNTVAITAGAASITDKNAVALDNIKAASLNVKAGGAVTQVAEKALEVTGATSVDAATNNVTLANAGNDFNTVAITAGSASITDKNAVALDNIKAASLNVKAGGAVTQVADKALEVTGATSVDAGTNNVTLANAGNDFNTVAITAGSASITDKNAVALDNIKTASLNVKAGGTVTQVAEKALEVTGATSVDAGTNDVTLANANNDFGSIAVTSGTASITDKNAVALDNIKAASLNVKAGGAVTQVADKALEVTGLTSVDAGVNDVTLANANNDFGSIAVTSGTASITDKNAVALDNIKAASLTLKAGGAVTQVADKALEVTGATSVDAGANDVTLANANNDFGSIAVTSGTASITDKNAITFDSIKAASLAVKAGGAVTQVADKALEVTGATTVDAGANNVTLANAGNDFNTVAITAGVASVTDKNAVALDNIKAASLTLKAGGAVTQVADKALEVTGATTVDAEANNVTLANAGNDFNTVAITAGVASFADKNAVALDNIKAESLTLKAGGAVTQVADKALEVTGATSVDAGTNDVTLANAGNDFNTVAITAGAASVTDKNAVALDNIKAASLTLKAGAAVTQVADKALEVTGATTVDAGANNVTLANANNDFGSIGVSAGAATITDKNAVALDNIKAASLAVKAGGAVTQVADKALEVTGATSVDAGANNVTLANAGNDFNSVAITAGSTSITDKNAVALDNIKAASLAVKAGGAVTQVADKALEVTGATSVDAGANNVTLANANNDFGSIGVSAGAASVTDKNAVILDNTGVATLEVKAGGAIEQNSDSALLIAGRSSFDTPETIDLPNLNNRFGGPVSLRGTDVSLGSDAQIIIGERNIRGLKLFGAPNRIDVADSLARVSGITQVESGNQTVSAPATTGPDSLTSRPGASESNGSAEPLFVFADVARTVPSGQVLVIDGGINVNFAGTSASGSNNNSGNTSEQQ